MKIDEIKPARKFRPGGSGKTEISHAANIRLESDEQITFITSSGKEHDFVAKSWGFYSTPSINGRLKDQGFKTALVGNSQGRIYIMAVEPERMEEFENYLKREKNVVLEWLDERKGQIRA